MRSQEPLNRPEGPVLPPHLQALVSGSSVSSGTSVVPASSAPAPRPASLASSTPLVSGRPSIANTTNIETLVGALPEVPVPAEQVQDKVGFIFNNLSQLNLQQKVGWCDDGVVCWLCDYPAICSLWIHSFPEKQMLSETYPLIVDFKVLDHSKTSEVKTEITMIRYCR